MPKSRPQTGGWFWTDLRIYTPFRSLAVAVAAATLTVGCGREGATARGFDSVLYDSRPQQRERAQTAAEELATAGAALVKLLTAQERKDLGVDERQRAHSTAQRFRRSLDLALREVKSHRRKLMELGARQAAARAAQIDQTLRRERKSLGAALAAVPADGKRSARAGIARRAVDRLVARPTFASRSTDTGYRVPTPLGRGPSIGTSLSPAYTGPTAGSPNAGLPVQPEPQDTQETDDADFSAEVRDLAAELEGDPVQIYNFVRNRVRYEPRYGLQKTATATLNDLSGSASEQAALLIALLRSSSVPARYVHGVVEMPIADAAEWLGLDARLGESPERAGDILSSGGIPAVKVRRNGVVTAVRFTHDWVEAFVAGKAYRGVDERSAPKRWLPLDPSVKRLSVSAPAAPVSQLSPLTEGWASSFYGSMESLGDDGAYMPTPRVAEASLIDLSQRVEARAREAGGPDETSVADLLGTRDIVPSESSVLPLSLPYRVAGVEAETREIPLERQARVSIAVAGSGDARTQISFSAPAVALENRRVTLAYAPASATDESVIDAYHGLLNTPSYGAQLLPVLRIAGRAVARGDSPVWTGAQEQLTVTYHAPGFAPAPVENSLPAGSLWSIVQSSGSINSAALEQRLDALAEAEADGSRGPFLTDASAGEIYSIVGSDYFLSNERYDELLAAAHGVSRVRLLSGAIVGAATVPMTLAGLPVGLRFTGSFVDVDHDVQSVVPRDVSGDAPPKYLVASAAHASMTESRVLERFLSARAASTSAVFMEAAATRIPLYQIDATNVGRLDALVEAEPSVLREVREAVSSGAVVSIPARSVTIGNWSGTGYMVVDRLSVASRLSGGTNGGELDEDLAAHEEAARQTREWEKRLKACRQAAQDAVGGSVSTAAAYIAWTAIQVSVAEVTIASGVAVAAGVAAPWATLALFVAVLAAIVFWTLFLYSVQQCIRSFQEEE